MEVERDDKKISREKTMMEAKGEERSPAPPPPPSSYSTSSRSSEEVGVKEEKEKDRGKDDAGEDEGYRTPTSPKNRIPEVRRCPPAPRKPPPLPYVKRKVRARLVDVEGEIGSLLSAELADAGPRTKKPRREREATNAC